jgi:hypothetical protein
MDSRVTHYREHPRVLGLAQEAADREGVSLSRYLREAVRARICRTLDLDPAALPTVAGPGWKKGRKWG